MKRAFVLADTRRVSSAELLVLEPAPGVLELKLSRPAQANSLTTRLLRTLVERLEAVAGDDSLGAVVLTGGPVLFSVGADVKEITAPEFEDSSLTFRSHAYRRVAEFPKPLIAAVCGPALGGGFELVLATDVVVAGRSARFGLSETGLGLIPGGGGTQRLMRSVGKALAMQMLLAGRVLGAEEAREAGIVSEVVEDAECLPRARALAQAIAARPREAVRLAKQAALQAFETPLREGLAIEHRHMVLARRSRAKQP